MTRGISSDPAVEAAKRAKISAANKGRKHSAEWNAKIGAGNRGKIRTPEVLAAMSARRLGKPGTPHAAEARAKIAAAKLGELNPNWRGDDVGYHGVHEWLYQQVGPARDQQCLHCGKPASSWANISHEYRRDVDDFMPLCNNCHKIYDNHPKAPRQSA